MAKRIRQIAEGVALTGRRLTEEGIARASRQYVVQAHKRRKAEYITNEQNLARALDDKELVLELIEDFLPVWRRVRHLRSLDEKLAALAQLAPLVLGKSMLGSDATEARQAAKELLDRVQGKPIERQMTMTMQVNQMSEGEIDNKLRQLEEEIRAEAGAKAEEVGVIVGEEAVVGGDAG